MDIGAIFIFSIILIAALLIPWAHGLMGKTKYFLITVLALAIAFAARAFFFEFKSGDYNSFLVHWVDYYRQNGGFSALDTSLGNYNLPYLYFLSLFSYIDINDLYLIKLLSVAFDVVLAFAMMKLTGIFTRSKPRLLAAYLITLLLPTVVLNGAKWGQCDSIYTAFAMLSLWTVMTGRPKLSMVFLALSFGFKLQAVFIMPVFLVMLFAKRIKVWDYLVFPATYVALTLPAVIAGRPFWDAFLLYFDQAETVGSAMNYNSPSLFSLFRIQAEHVNALSAAGIAAAFIFVFIIFVWTWVRRRNLTNEALVFIALLFIIGIPFLLPHMHDRYFFMADVLSILPVMFYLGYAPIAVFTSFASLLCYYSYFYREYLLPIQYGAVALIGVLLILLVQTGARLSSRRFSISAGGNPEPDGEAYPAARR